jgi:arylsulfatase A-like enzyme
MLSAAAVHNLSLLAAESDKRPNILFFEVDDLLYRFMGEHGGKFVETPNIDALAKEGVYFTNALCPGMMCGPSRNTLITGLYPHNLGFYRNGQMGYLPENVWSLPKALQRSGYETAWAGKCHVHPHRKDQSEAVADAMKRHLGFDYAVASLGRGMLSSAVVQGKNMDGDVYIEHLKEHGLYDVYADDCKKKKAVTSLPEDHYLDGFYTNKALAWLDKYDGQKPFMLWVNLSCPHGPNDAPQKYHDIYKDKEIPPPVTDSFGGEIPAGLLKDNRQVKPERIKDLRKGYAANVTFIDAMLGRVIDKLRKQGRFENTVVVFFSDHGIFMGNHGRMHKGAVFNEITNPCLVVRYPERFRQGAVEETPVELLGLVHTALDIAGAPEAEKKQSFGESFMPLLTGEGEYQSEYAFCEIEGFQLCFDGRYRYIANTVNKEKSLLYDMKNDPEEMKNIAESEPEISARMQEAVEKWLKETGPVLPAEHLRNKENLDAWMPPPAIRL